MLVEKKICGIYLPHLKEGENTYIWLLEIIISISLIKILFGSWKGMNALASDAIHIKGSFVFNVFVICFVKFIFDNVYNKWLPDVYFVVNGMSCTSIIRNRTLF